MVWLRHAGAMDTWLVHWHLIQAESHVVGWQEALAKLDLSVPQELGLYASILFEHLPTLSPKEQTAWKRRIRQEHKELIVPYAAYLRSSGQYEQADIWAKLAPDYANSRDAQLTVGISYFYRSGGTAEAERIFQSIYFQFGGAEAAYWYGRTLTYNGKPELAIPLLEEAVNNSQTSIVSWYLRDLGTAYAQVGRCAEADSAFNRSLQRDTSTANVERIQAGRDALSIVCKK